MADRASGSPIGSDALKVNATTEKYSTAGGTWSVRTNMNVPNTGGNTPGVSEYVSSVSCLAYGGQNSGYLTRTELYDDAMNTWTTVDSMNTSREALGGSSAGSQGALATGGFNGSTLNANELYASTGDFTRNTIYSTIPIETSKGGTAAASFSNTYGVIVADTAGTALTAIDPGSSGEVFSSNGSSAAPEFKTATALGNMFQVVSSDPEVGFDDIARVWYNSVSMLYKGCATLNTWTAKAGISTATRGLAGAGQQVDGGLIFGGFTTSIVGTTEQYDEGGNSWSSTGSLNTPDTGNAGGGSSTDALVVGGNGAGSPGTVTERFQSSVWTSKTGCNTAVVGPAGTGSAGEDFLKFGGNTGAATAVTERYSGTGDSWTNKTSMNTARFSIQKGGSGEATDALSIGGYTGAGAFTTVELYEGVGDTWTAKTGLNTAMRSGAAAGIAGGNALSCGGNSGGLSAVSER